jgi:anti-sigma-K factor RskA
MPVSHQDEVRGARLFRSRPFPGISWALAGIWDKAGFWRPLAAGLAVALSGVLVAALVARAPPDFSALPTIAVLRDNEQHPLWAIRLAGSAHQIAADSLYPRPAPAGQAYQLWLVAPGGGAPSPLGLLPQSGRKAIAEAPVIVHRMSGRGELIVTLEPAGGSTGPVPSGPILFRASLVGAR